jgi:hypothetical protein
VRFERTELFKADYKQLSASHRELFRQAPREFNEACDRYIASNDPPTWPARLRVKSVVNAPGVFEMTWSLSGPDGRATWEWTTVTDPNGMQYRAVRSRRLGDHKILQTP